MHPINRSLEGGWAARGGQRELIRDARHAKDGLDTCVRHFIHILSLASQDNSLRWVYDHICFSEEDSSSERLINLAELM